MGGVYKWGIDQSQDREEYTNGILTNHKAERLLKPGIKPGERVRIDRVRIIRHNG